MRKICVLVLLGLCAASYAFADTQDNAVFRTQMLPDNEVQPIAAPGNSANATITVHVTRDDKGNVNAATVTFDIDYTIASALTFTGLHIHNAPSGQNGPVVIGTDLSGTNTVSAPQGSGKITRVVNYAVTDTNGIKFVTGLLATPENYYVNIHTTANPGGFMRGQFLRSRLVFRPLMSSLQEVPAITPVAQGAALVEVNVNRDPQTGAIISGTVTFDVDYSFPSAVTITGLHIHNGATGVNGPVVIDTGTNSTSTAVTNATRGNIFRIVEINSSNTNGIAALNGLFADPTQFYVNMHTTANPGGAIRGQLASNLYAFFNQMTQAEENPPTGASGTADSMTLIRLDRDSTGNVTGGTVSFNVAYNMGSAQTFTGLHIHNGKMGVNGPVVLNTGISGTNPVVTGADGIGSIAKDLSVSSTDSGFDFMRGLVENPENYYINIHTTTFGGGIIRAQLAKETYHFKTNMSTANEVPPVTTADTAATGWVTVKINRDGAGNLTGGSVTFDVNFTNTGPITFTGLHIHYPGVAGGTGPVTINTGIGGSATVDSPTGAGNITRVVNVDSTNPNGMATLNALITAPDTAYINIHSTTFSGGVARSQMLPVMNPVALVAGGGDWLTGLTIRNTSTGAVQGIVDFFANSSTLMPAAVVDPNISFLIPPSGSATIATFNKAAFTEGFAKVFSNGSVAVDARFSHPIFSQGASSATTVTSRSVSLPVSVTASANTGVAIIAGATGTLTLQGMFGIPIAGGSRTIDVTAGQQISSFVTELLPGVTTPYSGTLTITTSAGTISVLGCQFDGSITPVTVTALP
jgi:hypothetical protein